MQKFTRLSTVVGVGFLILTLLVTMLISQPAYSADPAGSVQNYVHLIQGQNGVPNLGTIIGFGNSVTGIGDINGDGVNDMAVGVAADFETGKGHFYVMLMKNDATIDQAIKIEDGANGMGTVNVGEQFGYAVAGIGDLNQDGVPDIAVSSQADPGNGTERGAMHILFMKNDGTVSSSIKLADGTNGMPAIADYDDFGSDIAAIGDVDGDGVVDLAVGANGTEDPNDDESGLGKGKVYILFMNTDGTVKASSIIGDNLGGFGPITDFMGLGFSVSAVGDFNGDGTPDVAAGAPNDGAINHGSVYLIYLNSNGTVKSSQAINRNAGALESLSALDALLGTGLTEIGDLNNDGIRDLAVGLVSGMELAGKYLVLLMDSDGTVKSFTGIASDTNGMGTLAPNIGFGTRLGNLGDISGDGVPDLAIGAYLDSTAGPLVGSVFIISNNTKAAPTPGVISDTVKIADGSVNFVTLADEDSYGSSVTAVGDLDGDGVEDLVVGAEGDDTGGTDRGAIYVQLMNADGTVKQVTKVASNLAGLNALADSDQFGAAVTAVGDLNKDGVPDLAVGVPGDDTNGSNKGAVRILFMNSSGMVASETTIADNTGGLSAILTAEDMFGSSLTAIGDIDHDGVPDLAVGAPGADSGGTDTGAVHILLMNDDGTVKGSQTLDATDSALSGVSAGSEFGSSINGIGDFNRDGVPDLAIGAAGDDTGGTDRGAVHIVLMNSDGTAQSATKIADTTSGFGTLADEDYFGSAVTAVGDYNLDGVIDLVVGAPGDDTNETDQGAAYLLLMNGDGTVKSTQNLNSDIEGLDTVAEGEMLGSSLSLIGDLNGDGKPDLAIGAPGDDTGGDNRGALYTTILKGTRSTADGTVETVIEITESITAGIVLTDNDYFGGAVTVIGDVNFDGVSDLAVGAAGDDTGGTDRGAVYTLIMKADGTVSESIKIADGSTNFVTLADEDGFGSGLSQIGDINGDGVPDLVAGAPGDDTGGTDRGAMYVMLMNSSGEVSSTVKVADSTGGMGTLPDGYGFGQEISSIGDLNNDGIPDLAVGTPADDTGGTDRGAVHILLMNDDGTVQTVTTIADSSSGFGTLADGDGFGSSVTELGDVDGDGVTDLAVGAAGDDTNGTDKGAVHILFMNDNGTVKSSVKIADSTGGFGELSNDDMFGSSVSGVGDMNHDGVPDVAVGAPGASVDGSTTGQVYVLLLNDDGTVMKETSIADNLPESTTIEAGAQFGSSLSPIGDFNGDGSIDWVGGMPGASGSDDSGTGRGSISIMLTDPAGNTVSIYLPFILNG